MPIVKRYASESYVVENIKPVSTSISEINTSVNNLNTLVGDTPIPDWAKAETKPTYTASEVGADASGTANSVVSTHNTATDAHNDIRLLVADLTTRLNTLADSDDTTLDQMSEIVAYIKSNKTLIEEVTTNKINVSDIIDNLTTNVSNKPLSAAQGVALKALVDALQTVVNSKALASDLTSHTGNTSNPHGVTAAQVGLGNVDNVKQYSVDNPPPYPVTSVNGMTGDIVIDIPSIDGLATETYVDEKMSDKVSTPTAASVGQIIAVKTIDDDGKPTEWECVDLSNGGTTTIKTWTVEDMV